METLKSSEIRSNCINKNSEMFQDKRMHEMKNRFKKEIFVVSVSCTNIHHDVPDLVNHGMVKNTKT